jgi:hypothetical protein
MKNNLRSHAWRLANLNLKVVFLTYVFVQWLLVSGIYKQEYVDCEFFITPHVAKTKPTNVTYQNLMQTKFFN